MSRYYADGACLHEPGGQADDLIWQLLSRNLAFAGCQDRESEDCPAWPAGVLP